MITRTQNALLGAVVGALLGPINSAFIGFVLMAVVLYLQELISPQGATDLLVQAGIFAILIAPLASALSVFVGAIVGGVSELFPGRPAAGTFGGFFGAFLGTFVSLGIFGGDEGDLITVLVGIVTLAASCAVIGGGIKYLELRRATAELAREKQSR
jgi:hypothetical protein